MTKNVCVLIFWYFKRMWSPLLAKTTIHVAYLNPALNNVL